MESDRPSSSSPTAALALALALALAFSQTLASCAPHATPTQPEMAAPPATTPARPAGSIIGRPWSAALNLTPPAAKDTAPAVAALPAKPNPMHARIDALFSEFNRTDAPGAAALVMKGGSVLFKKAYGLAEVRSRRPITTSTSFRLASVTKQLTAMSVMLLAERGKLAYDDPIPHFLPGLPSYAGAITVRHLMNHTSGLPDYGLLVPDTQTTQIHDKDVLALIKGSSVALERPPGTRYKYSNTGYAFLALLVEEVSGQPFATFLRDNIFTPLDMSASVAFESGVSTVPERAFGYAKKDGEYALADQSATSAVLGDGGVYSSVDDLAKWVSALLGDRLVKPETMREAWTGGALRDGSPVDYGFGWYIETEGGVRHPYHTGSSIGFRNVLYLFPEEQFAVIILTNRNDAAPLPIARAISAMFIPGLSWPDGAASHGKDQGPHGAGAGHSARPALSPPSPRPSKAAR